MDGEHRLAHCAKILTVPHNPIHQAIKNPIGL
jgi:hypothetical protein